MIADAHCHVWRHWPYDWTPPEPAAGTLRHLVTTLDQHGVGAALVVGASLGPAADPGANRGNTDDLARAVAAHNSDRPDGPRLAWLADVDSRWSPPYRPRAGTEAIRRAFDSGAAGVSHYCREVPDGFFISPDGQRFLDAVGDRVLSIHLTPAGLPEFRQAMRGRSTPTVLVHHLGHTRDRDAAAIADLLRLLEHPRVLLKISGFAYTSEVAALAEPAHSGVLAQVYTYLGTDRLVWGSDYPVSMRHYDYRLALDLIPARYPFLDTDDLCAVFGGTLAALIPGLAR